MRIIKQKNRFSSRVHPKHILALSWKIATEPKLYWQLVQNPYTPKALQIISERFPDENVSDVIKAVILADLERKPDLDFSHDEILEEGGALSTQNSILSSLSKRIAEYHKKYKWIPERPSKDIVYDRLFKTVFNTNDIRKADQMYTQNQRLYLKLVIIDFIENEYRKSNSTTKILLIILAILALSFIFVVRQMQSQTIVQTQESSLQASEIKNNETQKIPTRLIIPAIDVNTAIQNVGITANGEMEVPDNYTEVGWLNLGTLPGQKGSAVITGHIDGSNGERGVFANLYKLKPGDKIYVEYNNSYRVGFVVREDHLYNAGYANEVFDNNDGSHLNLITCSGFWDKEKDSFSKRLVIFADLII